jgi:uncharacterized protein (UPF0548 family)
MFLLTKPSAELVREYLSRQENASFSYPQVGASRQTAPRGYIVDHNRLKLGQGTDTFKRAVLAVRAWKMFDIPWLELHPSGPPIEVGTTVALVVRHLKFWSLNSCRIAYLIDEHREPQVFGFAYGTLDDHAEIGEERFSVEYDSRGQSVWYDLYAFSRPRPLVRPAYPLARMLQRRFIRDSKAAMLRAVLDSSSENARH